MSSKLDRDQLKQWLDQLQMQSWQLELVISGFATVLLIGLNQPLNELVDFAQRITFTSERLTFIFIPIAGLKGAWFTLLVNLIVHVSLRGFWIATIGLRYVSEDIDFEQLRLAKRFDRFLRKKIGSFDDFIERLERICSVIFAFSFIIVFVIISFCLYFLIISLVETSLIDPLAEKFPNIGSFIGILFYVVVGVSSLLYFFDFVSLGRIKRIKWLALVYFPLYRVMGWLTLANLYRPLYYNLADNKFGRRVGLLIIPYILAAMIGSSLNVQAGKFFPLRNEKKIVNSFYDDQTDYQKNQPTSLIYRPSVNSKYVRDGFLELFIPYVGILDHPALEKICPDLVPAKKDKIFLQGVVNIQISDGMEYRLDSIISCFQELHRISIDDQIIEDPEYWLYTHPGKKIPGFLIHLDLDSLSRGPHRLKVQHYRLGIRNQTTVGKVDWQAPYEIPIWTK